MAPTDFITDYTEGDPILPQHSEQYAAAVNNAEKGSSYYAEATGSANAYAVTPSPAPPIPLTAGYAIRFKANAANTGPATLDVGTGAVAVKKAGSLDLEAGDIADAGQVVTVVYDGSSFQVQGLTGQSLPLTTKGDLVSRTSTDVVRVGVGTDGQLLTADSAAAAGVSWQDAPEELPLTTKGDLVSRTSTDVARVGVGTDGQILAADSAAAAGVSWQDAPEELPLTTKGDLVSRTSTDIARVGVGTDGQLLTADSVAAAGISWQDAPEALPLTTKGDLVSRTSTDVVRVGVGTDGHLLTADSTAAAGVSWQAGPEGLPLTTKGDLLSRSSSDEVRVPVGTDGQVLTADSTQASGLAWAAGLRGSITSLWSKFPAYAQTIAYNTAWPDILQSAGTSLSGTLVVSGGKPILFLVSLGIEAAPSQQTRKAMFRLNLLKSGSSAINLPTTNGFAVVSPYNLAEVAGQTQLLFQSSLASGTYTVKLQATMATFGESASITANCNLTCVAIELG